MNSISLKELYTSLQNKKVPNKDMNYLQYMFKMNDYAAVVSNVQAISENYGKQIDLDNQKLDLSSGDFALVTALTKSGWAIPAAGAVGGGVAGGATAYLVTGVLLGSNPVGWIIGGGVAAGTAIGGTIAYMSTDNGITYLPPTLYGYNSEDFKGLNCKEFTTLA